MGVKKIAISLQEDLLEHVDMISKKLNLSRSGYISSVLKGVTQELERANTTEKLNALFKDKALQKEQKRVSDLYLGLETDDGQEW